MEYGVIAEPLTAWREAFKAEIASRGWYTPKKRTSNAPQRTEPDMKRFSNESSRYIVPCPHPHPCLNTRACCLLQDVEKIAGRATPKTPPPDPEERPEDWWNR